MQPSFGGNNYYGHPSDGLAPALRWTAPVGGTYRFQGQFLPSGSGSGTMSYAILTANNPDFPDGSVPTLLSRATVGNQAVAISYDITTTVVTGQTVTWVVGTDGPGVGDSMEVMAKVTSVTLDTKISTVLSPTRSVAFPCDGVPHAPAVSVAGSSGLVIRSFAGVDGTTYDSSTPPTLKGKYSMTYSVAEDENYQAASINVPFTVGYWNAATEFWWNAPSSEASSAAWASGAVDAGFGGRTSQSQSLWSYGLLNTTGGSPVDPYPISITQTTSGPSNRGAFGQFWDSTTSGSYTYAPIGAGGLYLYNFLGTQIGVYGTPWFNLAPGYDGAGAGRVGTPNLTHMWLKSSNTGAGSDGFASALRWTAPAAGTYRFYGEFVPGGVSPYEQSFAILKSSPAGANNSGDTALLSRSTVVDDGPVTSYDVTAILAAGETVTWVVGTNGGDTNQMGVQAQVEFLVLSDSGTTDGIDNSWWALYGIGEGNRVATLDPDGDGYTNLQESALGTNPMDSSSTFNVKTIERNGNSLTITWSSVSGKKYQVQAATQLNPSSWQNVWEVLTANSGLSTKTVTVPAGASAYFVRVNLVP